MCVYIPLSLSLSLSLSVCSSNNNDEINENELNPKQAEDMMSNIVSFHGSLRLVDKVRATV